MEPFSYKYFGFDDAGQLEQMSGLNVNPESFAYDENGNRTTSSANGTTDIGEHNRLDEDADWDYTYDDEGNLTLKTAKVGGEYTTYTWDHRNRLTAIEDFDSSNVQHRLIEYTYDADDRLVSKMRQLFWTEVGPVAPGYEDPVFEHYVNQGSDRALMFDNNEDLAHRYVQGPIRDQLLFDQVFDALGQETGFFAPATDHLGTVRAVLNEQEAVHQAIEYDAFGEVTEIRDADGDLTPEFFLGPYYPDLKALDTVFGFAGRPLDADTGLSQNNARWYDPHTGRFISEDPIQDGANWYAYAGNDPINFRDPTGLSPAGNPLNNLFGGSNVFDTGPVRYDNPLGLQSFNRGLGYDGNRAGTGPVNINLTGPTNPHTIQRYQSQVDSLSQQRSNLNSQIATARQSADRARINTLTDQLQQVVGRQSVARDNLYSATHVGLNGGPLQTFSYQTSDRFSVGDAALSGLNTGKKAVVNAAAGSLSLGFYDGPYGVTQQDIYNGYNTSRLIAGVSTELLVGVATGGASRLGTVGKAALAFDTTSNAVSVGRGTVDAYNNGLGYGNALQIAGGAAGLGGNFATGGQALRGLASDAASLRLQFDPATFSTGGLGGARVVKIGQQGELSAGLSANRAQVRIPSPTGTAQYRIPDELTTGTLREVKNVARLSNSKQLQDFLLFSQQTNRSFVLQTRQSTQMSGTLLDLINNGKITHRPIGQ